MHTKEEFIQAIETGNTKFIDKNMNELETMLPNIGAKNLTSSLRIAAQAGYVDILYLVVPVCSTNFFYNKEFDSFKFSNNPVLSWIAAEGFTNLFAHILNFREIQKAYLGKYSFKEILLRSIKQNQPEIIELILDDDRFSFEPIKETEISTRWSMYQGPYQTMIEKEHSVSSFYLKAAIESNHSLVTKTLLQDDRFDPTENDHEAFKLASSLGYTEQMRLLRPYLKNDYIKTKEILVLEECLLKAVSIESVKFLLEDEASISIRSNQKLLNKKLVQASENGCCAIVKYLLENTIADPTTHRSDPLRIAVINSHLEIVQLFLDDGRANPQALGNLALRVAVKDGNEQILKCLLASPKVNCEVRGTEIIHMICEHKNFNQEKKFQLLQMIFCNLSLDCLIQKLDTIKNHVVSENKDQFISSKLVQTLGIFRKHHLEQTEYHHPQEVFHTIGKFIIGASTLN